MTATHRMLRADADIVGLVSPHPRTKKNPLGAGRSARAGEAATANVTIRLTAGERSAYQAAATATGVTLGEWIRAACDRALPKRRRG